MPNLDFFASRSDLSAVLDFVIGEAACEVFESYSDLGKPLLHFRSTADVLEAFDRSCAANLGLMLYAPAMRGRYKIKRFDLKKELFPNTPWRERIDGWGLIQLELRGVRAGKLDLCHTNHNSEVRALKWEATYPDFPPVAEWDFRAVTRISSRINRHIREKLAVTKIGSRPVLPGAQALVDAGSVLLHP